MHRRSLNSEPWPLNCAMCRCSSCVGRKSSWDESLPGLVATWVTQDCRHESSERDRAGWKRNAESLASSQSLFWQSGFLCSVFFYIFILYLQPSRTHHHYFPLPCPLAAFGGSPRTAPCTRPSATVSYSHKLSISLMPAPSQRRPRSEQQNHTAPGFGDTQREENKGCILEKDSSFIFTDEIEVKTCWLDVL